MLAKSVLAFLALAASGLAIASGTVPPSAARLIKLAPPPPLASGAASLQADKEPSRFFTHRSVDDWSVEITYVIKDGGWEVEDLLLRRLEEKSRALGESESSQVGPVPGTMADEDPSTQPVAPPDITDPNAPGPGTPPVWNGTITNTFWYMGWNVRAVYKYGLRNGVLGWHLTEWQVVHTPGSTPPPPVQV